jgi:hypothetical protein
MLVFCLIIMLLTAGLLTVTLAGSAQAQEVPGTGETTATATPEQEQETQETGERLDNNTVLLDKTYSQETGRLTLTIRSETVQQVTLSDAGALIDGGRIAQRSVVLKDGSVQEISIPATEVDGFVGASVATQTGLYGVPVETPGFRLDVPAESDTLALGVGVLLTPIFALLIYRRAERKEQEGVLRI